MLSFELSEEHRALQEQLRAYAKSQLLPAYVQRAAGTSIPATVRKELAAMGVLGIGLPEAYGGSGEDDPIALGVATEALAYGDVNVASLPIQTGLIGTQLGMLADEDVKASYIHRLVAGEIDVAIALTEAESGSDAAAMRTVATPVDSGWRLTGRKASITSAMTAAASIVYARAPGSERHDGISAFLVDLDAPGVTVEATADMGMRPLARGDIVMEDVFVPASHLCGTQGRGFAQVMGKFDFSRAAIGLMCLGAAQASLDEAAEWANERTAFGQPIAGYQGVSFPIAEHLTYMAGAREVCYKTLWLRAHGRPHTVEAAMSKWWAPKVAKEAIEVAITTVGHGAYSEDMAHQARFRDVFGYLIADGTAQIQKLIIATDFIGPKVRGR